MAPQSNREPIRHGGLTFVHIRDELHKGATRVFVECPICHRAIQAPNVKDHVEKHQANDMKASQRDAMRANGCVARPLPGQLGLFTPVKRMGHR
jgi:hypothetical protein